MGDKDLAGILGPLARQLDSLVVCGLPGNGRAAAVDSLAAAARAAGIRGVHRAADPDAGWQVLAPRVADGARGVVFGSFFTVAGIMPRLAHPGTEEPACARG
jgi:dihydrofolate synthase/folylpolyglutamate synthase